MNCQEFWNSMPELRDAAGERHLVECPACAARMSRQSELSAGLRTMAAADHRVGASPRVEARLRKAFRNQTGVASARPMQPVWAPVLTWAAALAAMITLAVFLVRDRQPVTPRPTGSHTVAMAMAAPAEDSQGDDDGFITLPNAGKLAENEEVDMVRVEVPRSAMIALGLEVSPERAGELVAADVKLGPDGLARAVRFLDSDALN